MVANLINENGNTVANQFVIFENGVIAFQSYNSRICEIRGKAMGFDNVVVLGSDWNYSITTMKHLYKFLKDNGLSLLASRQALLEAIDRGYARLNQSIAVWVDDTM